MLTSNTQYPSEELTHRQLLLQAKRQVQHACQARALKRFNQQHSALRANCDIEAEADNSGDVGELESVGLKSVPPLQEPGSLAADAAGGEAWPFIFDYETHYSYNYYFSPYSYTSSLNPNQDSEDKQRRKLMWVHLDILLLGGPRLHLPFQVF